MTIREFAEKILKVVGSDCPIEFKDLPVDDPKQRQPDISRARKILDWEPQVPLEQGLEETVKFFKGRI